MKKNTIHILHLVLSMGVGGAERVISHLVTGQPQGQVRQTVCCLDRIGSLGSSLQDRGYKMDIVPRRSGVDWRLVFRLRNYCRKQRVDIIHTHGESPWFYGALAANIIPWQRIPCITTIHGYGGGDRAELKNYRLWRWLARLSGKVVFVSRIFEKELLAAGLAADKTTTIYNGVAHQCGHEKLQDFDKRASLQELALNEDDYLIGIVARLSPIKNHTLLLRAVARLCETNPREIRLIVVGDGPERATLERLSTELSLDRTIVFCGERQDVAKYYALFDIFVLPSFSEGISMTILEAMAAGVPVVASDVGGNMEIIRHGKNGMLFPSDNLDALVQAISTLIQNKSVAAKLAAEGQRTVRATFSMDTMLTAYRELYHELVETGGSFA